MSAAETSQDPLVRYNELALAGEPPSLDEFCAQYPTQTDLRARIEALQQLQHDLERVVRAPELVLQPPPARVGDFEILRLIGHGGMGAVYLAEQQRPRRLCALKLLSGRSGPAFQRFRREADLLARLDHPNIARVFAYGEQEDLAYLATELVHGFSLRDLLSAADAVGDDDSEAGSWLLDALRQVRDGAVSRTGASEPAPVAAMLQLVLQMADGLAHAHARQVVHRDVKPSNVMVGFDGTVKLIDFGIAVPLDSDASSLRWTHTGTFIGSCDYAAPEQLRGESHRIGPWTDIYGLGATLYEMLTQRTPFEAASLSERLASSDDRPAPPRSHNRKIPRALDDLVQRALEPDPGLRPQDGAEMHEALAAVHSVRGWGQAALPRGWLRVVGKAKPARIAAVLLALLATAFGTVAALAWQGQERLRLQIAAERQRVARRVLRSVLENERASLEACLPPSQSRPRRGPKPPPPSPSPRPGMRAHVVVEAERVREVRLIAVAELSTSTSECLTARLRQTWVPGAGLQAPVEVTVDLGVRAFQDTQNTPETSEIPRYPRNGQESD